VKLNTDVKVIFNQKNKVCEINSHGEHGVAGSQTLLYCNNDHILFLFLLSNAYWWYDFVLRSPFCNHLTWACCFCYKSFCSSGLSSNDHISRIGNWKTQIRKPERELTANISDNHQWQLMHFCYNYNKNYESHAINKRKPSQTICLVGFTNGACPTL
jgi:hypothetical protein